MAAEPSKEYREVLIRVTASGYEVGTDVNFKKVIVMFDNIDQLLDWLCDNIAAPDNF